MSYEYNKDNNAGDSSKMKSLFIEILAAVVIGVLIFFALQFSVQRSVVEGSSMSPNLQDEQVLIVSKLAYKFGEPERGDIIIFPPPHILDADKDYIKRIIGMPGEEVEIINGDVFINGKKLEEPYIEKHSHDDMDAVTVPSGHYFVLGDNRSNSSDSRGGWTVPGESITGKAWLSIWPFDLFGLAPNEDLEID